jgi:hypothetical protein
MDHAMKVLRAVAGVGALVALVFIWVRESSTRRELTELRAAVRQAADTQQSSAGPPALPPSAVADLRALTTKMLSDQMMAAAPTAGPPPKTPSADHPANSPMTLDEEREQVLAAYGKEQADPTWRSDAEAKLAAAVRTSLPQSSRLKSLECRTTMCKLEIAHADPNAVRGDGLRSWLTSMTEGWDGAFFVAGEREERGEIVQTLVPLKGHKLPIDGSP